MQLKTIAVFFVFYLIGSVLPAAFFADLLKKGDIFRIGSGNPGFMNALKTLGWPCALLTLFYDVGKSWVAIVFAYQSHLPFSQAIGLGLIVVLGDCFSCINGFRGGKGAASCIGILLGSIFYVGYFGPLMVIFLGMVIFSVYYWIYENQEIAMTLMVLAAAIGANFSHNIDWLARGEIVFLAALVIALTWIRAEPLNEIST